MMIWSFNDGVVAVCQRYLLNSAVRARSGFRLRDLKQKRFIPRRAVFSKYMLSLTAGRISIDHCLVQF
jgi:hypothetical protein